MQRGLLFLICAALLPLAFLSLETNGNDLNFLDDVEDYEILNTEDIPFDTVDEDVEVALAEQRGGSTSSSVAMISREARFGLINHNNICYMSAFITAIFNVHSFREALYACEPENATTVMVAEVFAKLQTAKSPISTELCLMPTLKAETQWVFGMFQDNMEFGGKILDMLPKSVKSLYSVAVRTDYYLEGDRSDVLLKSKVVPQDLIIIMPVFKSISDSIESRFRSQVSYLVEQVDFHEYEGIIEPFSGKSKGFSTIAEEFIVDRPEIIVFGIGRKKLDGEFDETPMELDFEITLPGLEEGSEPVQYILQSFCYHVPGHYISYARDFTVDNGDGAGVWYQYNDSNVSAVASQLDFQNLKRHADTGATLAFYVRSDRVVTRAAYREPQIPERIMRVTKLMLALEEIQERRREMVVEEKKKQYRSPPAPVADYSSPKSLDTASMGVSSPSIIIPSSHNRSSILSDDDKKRSKNIPSPTNSRFFEDFPLDADYFRTYNPVKEA